MKIVANNTGVSGKDLCYITFSIILQILILIGAVVAIIVKPAQIGIGVCVVAYITYLIVSCCQASTSYINSLTPLKTVFEKIEAAIKAKPKITFHIACYHMETV